jgi:hypothetical protein
MALISVAQANPNQPKKSTLEKVALGFDIANGVLGVGLKGAEVYNDFQRVDLGKDQLAQEKSKLNFEVAKNYEPAEQGTPGAVKFDLGDSGPQYFKPRPVEWEGKDYISGIGSGVIDPIDAAEGERAFTAGEPVSKIRVSGIGEKWVRTDAKKAADLFSADLKLKNANAKKAEAEAAQVGKEDETKKVDAMFAKEKDIRGELKEPLKDYYDSQNFARQAIQLQKDGSPQAQYASIYAFIRSLAPGIVSDKETDAAGQGILSENLSKRLAAAGVEAESTVDANGNPRIFLSEKAQNNLTKVIVNNLALKQQSLNERLAPFENTIREYGLKRENIVPSFSVPQMQKPKTIMQNGNTYTLNEKTGEYE